MLHRISLIAMAFLYIAAGVNHFWHPQFYLPVIPPIFPAKATLNLLAGLAEVLLGLLLFPPASRRRAAYGIIALLIAFLPVHIWMIVRGGCAFSSSCLPGWLLWLRLLAGQPLLIWWAWSVRNLRFRTA